MIVFSRVISEKHRNRLRERFPNQEFYFCPSTEVAENYAEDAEVYVTFGPIDNNNFLEKAKNLKWVHVLSAGLDNFPFHMIKEKNILLTNVRGIHGPQMSEYAIAMILQVYRQGKKIIKNEEEKIWDSSVKVQEITGKTMVIVGTGAIGSEVARIAKAFRMKTIGVSRSGKPVENFDEVYKVTELDEVLPKGDFVISILPNTEETENIYTYERFKQMQDHAIFLNMGRGEAVVEEDLLKAIREKEIAHAILDVVREEPLREDHPFWEEENITITPHISGLSPNYLKRGLAIFEENLKVFEENGKNYINKIDLDRGY